ncbi:MAG: hypothetical protein R6V04_15275 [bacterium]
MKKGDFSNINDQKHSAPMKPEYDFRNMPGGTKGKYYRAYREAHTVKVHQEDGSAVSLSI